MSRQTEKFQRTEFRHNPYIGTFQRTEGTKTDINRHNPYIGYVNRHAPTGDSRPTHPQAQDKPFRRNFISHIQISQQRRPVNMLVLKNLPLSQFSASHFEKSSGGETPVCAICLDAFKDGDELRNLNCSHCFHRACVDIWLLGTLSDDIQLNGTCPTCRQHAASSPTRPKPLQVTTRFAPSDQSANMSDLSVRSSSVTESSDPTALSFDLVSPMSPDWSHDEIFHRAEEDNCLHIGHLLLADEEEEDDDLSVESMADCRSLRLDPSPEPGPVATSELDNILEDEPSIVESPRPALARAPFPRLSTAAQADDASEVSSSGFSVSQYSDCGFPLSSPRAGRRGGVGGE